jgi:hypothetical protein
VSVDGCSSVLGMTHRTAYPASTSVARVALPERPSHAQTPGSRLKAILRVHGVRGRKPPATVRVFGTSRTRTHRDDMRLSRPVTPEVAGSSPVAPAVGIPAIGILPSAESSHRPRVAVKLLLSGACSGATLGRGGGRATLLVRRTLSAQKEAALGRVGTCCCGYYEGRRCRAMASQRTATREPSRTQSSSH